VLRSTLAKRVAIALLLRSKLRGCVSVSLRSRRRRARRLLPVDAGVVVVTAVTAIVGSNVVPVVTQGGVSGLPRSLMVTSKWIPRGWRCLSNSASDGQAEWLAVKKNPLGTGRGWNILESQPLLFPLIP
tara:strand:- start:2979 stop:3365 length:387 start_codon:yes stop_codon:yes gene_type:complete